MCEFHHPQTTFRPNTCFPTKWIKALRFFRINITPFIFLFYKNIWFFLNSWQRADNLNRILMFCHPNTIDKRYITFSGSYKISLTLRTPYTYFEHPSPYTLTPTMYSREGVPTVLECCVIDSSENNWPVVSIIRTLLDTHGKLIDMGELFNDLFTI